MFDILSHREEFTGLQDKCYFNFGGQGILPRSSLEKIIDSYNYIEKVGAFSVKINNWIYQTIHDTKSSIASEIGVSPDTIALTENVTVKTKLLVISHILWNTGQVLPLKEFY